LIGRSDEVDLKLSGNSVSRRHALLRVHADAITLEDLGSSNGTIVRGERTTPHQAVSLIPGESFLIGDFVVVLRPRRSIAQTRHVWSPEYFEARVAEQCERCRESGGAPFYVLHVEVSNGQRIDEGEVIASVLKPSDVLGRLSKHEWSVLLLDPSDANANVVAGRVVLALSELGCEANARVLGYPRDGMSAGALMAKASANPDGEEEGGALAIVRSPSMVALYRQTDPIARAPLNVLILGETGVGKDVLAQSIHDRSDRRGKPFLRLNCAALAEPLLESELFGHEKGAFTGAHSSKQGLLESAAGGTVFLDEIGEFPQRLQPKLLQVLETREILSVGSVRARPIDVRFVAATNRDLEAESLAGHFRSDLYYRLAGFTAVIPPLRERREDIIPLAQEFVRRSAEKMSVPPVRIRDDAAMRLLDYPWPGNVRELRNVIERAVVLSEGRGIGPEHLPLEKMGSVLLVGRSARGAEAGGAEIPITDLTPDELEERKRILDALTQCAGNQSKAAARLGISRSTLINRLDAYRIGRPRKRPS
jgi:DNA-binding NtrC family response regulator